MNKLITLLKKLKKNNIVAVKQALEDEGASFDDLSVMRKVTKKAKVSLNVKIGGCEAKNDIFFCRNLNVDALVAPMVESKYALKKFIQCSGSIKKNLLFINLETLDSLKNLDKMLKTASFKFLDGVVIGRSDLAGSIDLKKKDVDSEIIYNLVKKTFSKLRKKVKKKLILKMGGSITPNSANFIRNLYSRKLLDSIETRNIEIKLDKASINNLEHIIPKAFEFELEWLKYKLSLSNKQKNKFIKQDYLKRASEIKKRLSNRNI